MDHAGNLKCLYFSRGDLQYSKAEGQTDTHNHKSLHFLWMELGSCLEYDAQSSVHYALPQVLQCIYFCFWYQSRSVTIIQQIHVIALSVIHERLQILFRLRQKLQSLQLALEGYFHLNGETTKKPPKKLVFGAMTTSQRTDKRSICLFNLQFFLLKLLHMVAKKWVVVSGREAVVGCATNC